MKMDDNIIEFEIVGILGIVCIIAVLKGNGTVMDSIVGGLLGLATGGGLIYKKMSDTSTSLSELNGTVVKGLQAPVALTSDSISELKNAVQSDGNVQNIPDSDFEASTDNGAEPENDNSQDKTDIVDQSSTSANTENSTSTTKVIGSTGETQKTPETGDGTEDKGVTITLSPEQVAFLQSITNNKANTEKSQ